jgi:hypothetical protein
MVVWGWLNGGLAVALVYLVGGPTMVKWFENEKFKLRK